MTAVIGHLMVMMFTVSTEHLHVSGYILACLFKSAARLRTNEARFTVEDIDFPLCTHYIYGYARVDVSRNTISSIDPDTEEGPHGLYRQFNSAKERFASIKTLLSVGGPSASSAADFHDLPDSDTDLLLFSENSLAFVKQHNFDGLDVDWQYPDNPAMKRKLSRLLKALRGLIRNEKLLLTATCPGFASKVNAGFDVPEINKNVNFVFVRAFELAYSLMLHATFSSPLYHDTQVCMYMSSSKQFFDNVQKNPYLVSDDLWVGYENERSLQEKIRFLSRLSMAGVYFSSLDEDDFSGKRCKAGRFPLLSHIKRILDSAVDSPPDTAIPSWYQMGKKYLFFLMLFIVGFAIGVFFSLWRKKVSTNSIV